MNTSAPTPNAAATAHEWPLWEVFVRSKAGLDHKAADFKRYGSARQLYNYKVDNASAY